MPVQADNRARTATVIARRLPAFRPVALQLLRLVFQDDVPFTAIAKTLALDPVLSSEVLRIANSGLFGRAAEIKSVLHAVAIVGLNRMAAVVLASSLWRGFPNPPPAMIRTWWRHSIATAFISEHASRSGGIDHAYTAGLLHSIGQLALMLADLKAYETMVEQHVKTAANLEDIEVAHLGVSSAAVSRALADQLHLPRELAFAMGHYGRHGTDSSPIAKTVATGCIVAEYLGFGPCGHARDLHEEDLPERARSLIGYADLLNVIAERINALECSLIPA